MLILRSGATVPPGSSSLFSLGVLIGAILQVDKAQQLLYSDCLQTTDLIATSLSIAQPQLLLEPR